MSDGLFQFKIENNHARICLAVAILEIWEQTPMDKLVPPHYHPYVKMIGDVAFDSVWRMHHNTTQSLEQLEQIGIPGFPKILKMFGLFCIMLEQAVKREKDPTDPISINLSRHALVSNLTSVFQSMPKDETDSARITEIDRLLQTDVLL